MVDTRELRVLVPLDGSPEAESILPAIQPLLEARDVRLTLLSVARPQESGEACRFYLSKMKRKLLLDGVRCETRAEWGLPAEEILYQGAPARFDLIAMTTHGRTGLRRVLLGSVAEEVVRHSRTPILVNRPFMVPREWTRIVVGLDGSALAESVLPDALRLARTFGASLHLVRAEMPPAMTGVGLEGAIALPPLDPKPYLQKICTVAWNAGVAAVPVPREGPPAYEIGKVAEELGAGLIVLTTHGKTGLARLFLGSTAEEVLRTAPCPVLVRRTVEAEVPVPVSWTETE